MAQNIPTIANFCCKTIHEITGCDVRWNDFHVERGVWRSTLLPKLILDSRADDSGRAVPVIPIEDTNFYISLNMSFDLKTHKEMNSFSLKFYDDVEWLFRADWAVKEKGKTSVHAQPHWHFNNRIRNPKTPDVCRDSFAKEIDFENFLNESSIPSQLPVDYERVHFYMAYDVSSNSFCDLSNQKNLTNWFQYTINYMKVQFRGLSNHQTLGL